MTAMQAVGVRARVTIVAPTEVDVDSVSGLFEAVDRALMDPPSALCLDFGETTFCASDGAYLVSGAAASCDAVGVSLRVIESPALRRLLDLAGLTGQAEWRAFAHRVVVDRPGRLSSGACQAVVAGLTQQQLVAARSACWRDYHGGITAKRRVASRQRLRIVQRELRLRSAGSTTAQPTGGSRAAQAPAVVSAVTLGEGLLMS